MSMRTVSAIALALLVAACGSGSSGSEPSTPDVIGQWELVEGPVDGAPFPVVDGYRITMNVEPDGTLGGTSACNGYGGSYVADGEDLIVGELSSTAVGCSPEVMDSEQAYMSVLRLPLESERTGDELVLRHDGDTLRFEAVTPVPTQELIGTEWLLASLVEGETASTPAGGPATLLLTQDGSVRGSTGCRSLDGEYVINADTVLFTTFSALGECPPSLADQDGLVVTVLGDGFTVNIQGSRLTVTSSGNQSLVYEAEGDTPDRP